MTDLVERFRFPILVLLVVLVGTAAAAFYFRLPRPETTFETIVPSSAQTPEKEIKVYVSGAVNKPGVYRLRPADRVEDAVKAAGGGTAEADLTAINLAARVLDEMQVHVPKTGESAPALGSGAATQKISINTGSEQQLESLPGIGPVTAKRILDYRAKNGPFKKVEDLVSLKIVNASTFDKIKDLIVP